MSITDYRWSKRIRRPYQCPRPSDQRSKHTCPLSDLVQPHKLSRRRDDGDDPPLFVCYACKGKHLEGKRYYYYCATCDLELHRGCHKYQPKIRHPFHSSHPLTLVSYSDSSKIPHEWRESSSDSEVYTNDHISDNERYEDSDGPDVNDGDHVEICNCCLRQVRGIYYHCSICNFILDFPCAINPPPLGISHPKSHNHTLTLFPRRLPLPCDVCGISLDDRYDVVYACLPCNHMVHRTCIYLPRVIKITRHPHRLSLIPSQHTGNFSCGVCRETVDVSYGHYSCKNRCDYAVHSRCAIKKEVWDGKDLEEVPEEPEENVEPFVRIDEETIQHFTHDHYLKLQGKGSLHGGKRFCEACSLPISIYDAIYSCMQCKYVLHEACACLPRVKHHSVHKHPLTLHQSSSYREWFEVSTEIYNIYWCDGCARWGSGFMYQCHERGCEFVLDVTCASLTDTLFHESHPNDDHPLFINLSRGNDCMGCKWPCSSEYLECMKCPPGYGLPKYLGFYCATLPSVAHYKHDSHPLTLCYGEKGIINDQHWCELCESELDANAWFYTCDSCSVTLHVTCLLGSDIHIKPQHVTAGDKEIEITCNDGSTRPFCYRCSKRCGETLVFKWEDEYFCNYNCVIEDSE